MGANLPPGILSAKKNGSGIVWRFKCECGKGSFVYPHLYEKRVSFGLKCHECTPPEEYRKCGVDGCSAKHVSHGYCRYHYNTWKRLGDPLAIGPRNNRTMIGARFGSLVVIAFEGYDGYRRKRWMCKCDCGRSLAASGSRLRTGKTVRCATCTERLRPTTTDLTGETFGLLIVTGRHDNIKAKSKKSYWKCLCRCGNEVIVSRNSLTHGNTSSCGCLWRESVLLPNNLAAKRMVYRGYQNNAKKRALIFDLSLDQFVEIAEQDCHYCGRRPHKSLKATVKGHYLSEDFIHNGIDRKDNRIGYVDSNCLPCCFQCNYAKLDRTYEEFMDWIQSLVKKHGSAE